jgi:hypothetical protein
MNNFRLKTHKHFAALIAPHSGSPMLALIFNSASGQPVASLLIALLLINLARCQVALAHKGIAPTSAPHRCTIQFPQDSIGSLSVLTKDGLGPSFKVGQAAGRLAFLLPADGLIKLEAGVRLFRDPKLLTMVEPPIINMMTLQFIAADETELNTCDRVIAYLPRFKDLQILNLNHSDASDTGLSNLRGLPKLRFISVLGGDVRGASFKALQTLPNSEDIELAWCPIEKQNFEFLQNFPKLTFLGLARTKLNEESMRQILKCRHLKKLVVSENPIKGAFLKDFRTFPDLEELRLRQCPLDKENLAYLQNLPHLNVLDLGRTGLAEKEMPQIAKCSHINKLYLGANQKINDRCLSYLSSLRDMTYLDLQGTSISMQGLQELSSKCPKLVLIGLPDSLKTESKIKELKKIAPRLTVLELEKLAIDKENSSIFAPLH